MPAVGHGQDIGEDRLGRLWRHIDAHVPDALLAGDPDGVRRARLLVVFPLVLLVGALVASALQAAVGRLPSVLIPIAAAVLSLSATQLLRVTGSISRTGHLQMLALFAALSAAMIASGGLGGARLFTLSIVPMMAALLLGAKAAIVWTLPAMAEVTVLLWLLQAGVDLAPAQGIDELQRTHGLAALAMIALTLGVVLFYERIHQRAMIELRAERDRADRATRVKSEFLSNMSHEIRTPLNGVIGMLEVLETDKLDREQSSQLAVARQCSEHLVGLLDEILDLSKVEAGRMELVREPIDLFRLVELAAAGHAAAAAAKGIDFGVSIGDGTPRWVFTDRTRLHQVLTNLVHNAVKFTAHGGVTLRVDLGAPGDAGLRLRFSVTDTGRGIDPVDTQRLFESFEQASPATASESGGTGLGLAISRRIVELLGGHLAVESEPGRGSRFFFELSLEPATEEDVLGAARSRGAAPQHRNERPILVVDDSAANRLVTRAVLQRLGFSAEEVGSGQEAVERLEAMHGSFAAVLMDLRMPGMDGHETTRRIRARERERGFDPIPIVALTASCDETERKRALEAGMDDLVSKPTRGVQLEAAITGALRSRYTSPG